MSTTRNGQKETTLADKAKELVRGVLEVLENLIPPVSQPAPIPVRNRPRYGTRR